ncbi:MAG: signal transduction histidine kinase [Lentimonas sp.]|jgi:signal transduction histidine kinase
MNLIDHPFLLSIPETQRLNLAEEIEIITFKDQELIFKQDDSAHSIYLVLEGEVEFNKKRDNNSSQPINRSGVGSFFGAIGIMTGEKRTLRAVSCGASILGRIPKESLDIATLNAEPSQLILRNVISHLKRTTRHHTNEVRQLEKLAMVGSMLTSLLHDFKGPCSIISLGSHLISQRHKDDPKTSKICSNIELQIQQMAKMVNDLAAFPDGGSAIIPQLLSLEDLFRNFHELKAPLFNDTRFSLEMEANKVTLEGDADKLLRVIQNLVSNAIEALPNSDDFGVIRVEANEVEGQVYIRVIDNGSGIPPEIQGNFFEPFATYGKSYGSGLGTAIAKSIVEAHCGTIHFETSSQGTIINIAIPQKQPR